MKCPDILGEIEEFEQDCKKNEFNLNLKIHLKSLVVFATGKATLTLAKNLTAQQMKDAWPNAKEGTRYALNFLKMNVGIDALPLLSSPFLIIALAYFCFKRDYKLSSEDERRLRYWVLAANMTSRYSRYAEKFLNQDLQAIRSHRKVKLLLDNLKKQVDPKVKPTHLLAGLGSQSGYFKTMFLAFRQSGAKDWQDQHEISFNSSESIFPKAIFKESKVEKTTQNNMCNLTFFNARTNNKISDKGPDVYLSDIIEAVGGDQLDKQCIPKNRDLWRLEAYDRFLKARRKLVAKRLNEFLDHKSFSHLLSTS